MSIAVTGACGFIGPAIVKELNEREISDICLVDYASADSRWTNLTGLAFSEFITPACFDPSGFDTVIHLGADSSTAITFKEAELDYRNAIELFDMVDSSETRIVYASSAGTYGIDRDTFSDELLYELKPKSPYAMCKHMIDMYVTHNCHNVIGLKYSNVFGPGEYHKGKMASMIMQWYHMIRDEKQTPLFLPEDAYARDFIYVKDAARMTVDLALNDNEDASDSAIFNIGSGEAVLFSDILYMIYDVLKIDTNINKMEMPSHLKPQYQPLTCLDMSNTANEINVETMPIRDAIEEYLMYLKDDLRIGER